MHQPTTSPIYQMHWDSPTPPPKCITSFYCCTQFDPQPLFLLQLRLFTHDIYYLNRENENCVIKRRKSCSTFLSRGAAQCPHPARRTTSAFLVKKQNHNSRQRKNHETLIFMIFKSTDIVLITVLFCFRRDRTRQWPFVLNANDPPGIFISKSFANCLIWLFQWKCHIHDAACKDSDDQAWGHPHWGM